MALIATPQGTRHPRAVKARGVHIEDENGQSWLDGSSGAIACSIGHGHPKVLAAMQQQASRTSFLYRTQFTNAPSEQLADRLCDRLGYDGAFFVNSGSEAVEAAIRLAQQFWRVQGKPEKRKILSRRISYHGTTVTALGLSGHWQRRRDAGGTLPEDPSVHTPYCLRCPLGHRQHSCGFACADMLEHDILRHGSGHIAAIILEPITGASGAAIVPPPGYLRRIRSICDRHDILLIADEILTGLGRTGKWLALDHDSITADILCLGKGLNAGYFPISAILAKKRIHDALARAGVSLSSGHTHSNHPVGAAVANAVLDILEEDSLVERGAFMGKYLEQQLRPLVAESDIIGDLRGCGMLWGLELVSDTENLEPFPPALNAAARATQHAFENGLIVYPASGFINGAAGDAIIIAPPLTVTKEEIGSLCSRLSRALQQTAAELFMKQNRSDSCQVSNSSQA